MVVPAFDGARVGVVLRLQSIAQKFPPGTEPSDTADHAIGLALSPRRPAEDSSRLFYHAWRDAKRIRRRRRPRQPVLDSLTGDSPLGLAILEGRVPGAVSYDTPEVLAASRDLERRVRERCVNLGPYAGKCLEGMLIEESIGEGATRLSVPERRIKRLRAQVRAAARAVLVAQETT